MSNNILKIDNKTIIFNGGEPLEGCPKSWDEAYKWVDKANANKNEHCEPKWKFDCGFKLDFDGPILDIESRFYPPKTHYGDKWDGNLSVRVLGKTIHEKYFEEDTLDQLKEAVESFVKQIVIDVLKKL